jgi:hypothetical protein
MVFFCAKLVVVLYSQQNRVQVVCNNEHYERLKTIMIAYLLPLFVFSGTDCVRFGHYRDVVGNLAPVHRR